MISKSEERRNQILVGAFKLFLVKEYADVTTADLEEIIGLSRGAIYYEVKNKEGLYRAVIDKFVFELLSNSLKREELVSNEKPFLSFIMNELNLTKERMNSVRNTLIDEGGSFRSFLPKNRIINSCLNQDEILLTVV